MIIGRTLPSKDRLLRMFFGGSLLALNHNRENHPWKWRYPSLGDPAHYLRFPEGCRTTRHDCRYLTPKRNRRGGISGQVWEATLQNPTFPGDVTYESLPSEIPDHKDYRL